MPFTGFRDGAGGVWTVLYSNRNFSAYPGDILDGDVIILSQINDALTDVALPLISGFTNIAYREAFYTTGGGKQPVVDHWTKGRISFKELATSDAGTSMGFVGEHAILRPPSASTPSLETFSPSVTTGNDPEYSETVNYSTSNFPYLPLFALIRLNMRSNFGTGGVTFDGNAGTSIISDNVEFSGIELWTYPTSVEPEDLLVDTNSRTNSASAFVPFNIRQ